MAKLIDQLLCRWFIPEGCVITGMVRLRTRIVMTVAKIPSVRASILFLPSPRVSSLSEEAIIAKR